MMDSHILGHNHGDPEVEIMRLGFESCQYPQEPCSCERQHGENSLRNDLAYDVSWGFGIKDRKLLDTVMDRVMETIDAWKQRELIKNAK